MADVIRNAEPSEAPGASRHELATTVSNDQIVALPVRQVWTAKGLRLESVKKPPASPKGT